MGVLSCDRKGCLSIMCDYYSHQHGYLCSDCLDELCILGVKQSVDNFMDSDKGCNAPIEASEAYFKTIFEDRHENISDW